MDPDRTGMDPYKKKDDLYFILFKTKNLKFFNQHQINYINVGSIIYLSVDRMCNNLSRNSLNICGHVEDRCTCNLVKNSCKACVAVGPT